MLKSKKVTIDKVEYLVSEMSLERGMALMAPSADGETSLNQNALVSECVTVKGVPVNPAEIGMTVGVKLIQEVMAINGLGDEAGND